MSDFMRALDEDCWIGDQRRRARPQYWGNIVSKI